MNKNELSSLEKTIVMALMAILGMAILSGLFSCRGTKIGKVYQHKNTHYFVEK
jgi:hypothetical protein